MESISAEHLAERYDGFLLDAYGVLVTSNGAIPGANAFLQRLRELDKPFVILTNDASRLPETSRESYAARGVEIGDAPVVTSGSLLELESARLGLRDATCFVLGPEDSREYARRAGARLVDVGEDAQVVVIGDESGFEFLPTVDETLTMIVRRTRRGRAPLLLLPNPDRIYPKTMNGFGVASGAIAAMIEAALEAAFGEFSPRFEPLGKPHRPIFDRALDVLGVERSNVAMVGDQLETDIRGANAVGIDSVLVSTGVASATEDGVRPTWQLSPFET